MDIKCAHTNIVPIETLVPNPRNPNKHPDEQIKLLAKIMKHQGWRNPIVVSKRSGFMTKGHGRLMAAQINGWNEAPIDEQDYKSEADEYADMVADNKIAELAESDMNMVIEDVLKLPDLDLDLLGIPDFQLPTQIDPGADEDEIPSNVDSRVKPGDLWTLGDHKMLCGDCTSPNEVERLMAGDTASLCFTSPPYADQRDYSGNLELDPKHLAKFLMAPAEIFAVNLGLKKKDHVVVPYWQDYIDVAESLGLKLLSWNIWDKMQSGSVGHQTTMFPIEHEWIFVFGKKPKQLNKTEETKWGGLKKSANTMRQKDGSITAKPDIMIGDLKSIGTVLRHYPEKARNFDFDHPAMFPVGFPEKYIEACTSKNEIVFEPFGGSGSTLIACEKTQRKCRITEIDPKYCDIILHRWEKYTGKKAQLMP